jgi:hypothetical protein
MSANLITTIRKFFLILIFVFTACAMPQRLFAETPPDKCSSHKERMAFGEIMSLAIGCKRTFPELTDQVDQSVGQLKNTYPGCFAEYERLGETRNQLEVAIGMGAPQLKQNKEQFCVADLRDGVKKAQMLLNK